MNARTREMLVELNSQILENIKELDIPELDDSNIAFDEMCKLYTLSELLLKFIEED
jgi:spore coat protein CotF